MKLPYRVLVLEDDENALAGIVELLSESGYDVTACVRVRRREAHPVDHDATTCS